MLARSYDPLDIRSGGLDRLIRHDNIVDAGIDRICVVGDVGKPTGVLVYRPGAWVHELEVGNDLHSRRRAESLVNRAFGESPERTAIFLVRSDNVRMIRFMKDLGAILQADPGDLLYTLQVR